MTLRVYKQLTAHADEVETYRKAVIALAGMADGI